ncbi:hypothetical protein, partial [Vibrio sp. 10N.261.55.A7]|uniref:hypothetical protein n=1 Tax=Vibrio sp. 10N.261.55.A7 TaxID=1880851 RepID=UPI000C822AE2
MRKIIQAKIVLIVLASSVLYGCGDSSSVAKNELSSLNGKAIDGYIEGAMVFLDLNYNGEVDSGEPTSVTGEGGDYTLDVTTISECSNYAPIIIDVPIGAIDHDSPNVPISEPYRLVYPPSVALQTNQELKFTTPITTLLWSDIQPELAKFNIVSCDSLKDAVDVQQKILQDVEEQSQRLAQYYNVSVESLYSDFIQEQNSELYALAQKMMPAIKKSYQETKVLERTYPNAQRAYVEYYWQYWDEKTMQSTDKWIKRETVIKSDSLTYLEHEISTDLETEISLINQVERHSSNNNGLVYEKQADFYLSDLVTEAYTCITTESLEQSFSVSEPEIYGIKNTKFFPLQTKNDWSNCNERTIVDGYTQTLKVTRYNKDMPVNQNEFYYDNN